MLCVIASANSAIEAQTLREQVEAVPSKSWEIPFPEGELIDEMVYMFRLNNRYALNKWYRDLKGFDKQEGEYLDFEGKQEKHIRPSAHQCAILALSLQTPVYSEAVTGVSREQAKQILFRLISSLAYRHKSNSTEDKGAWGDQWQSAMWASRVATGAWMVWEQLPPQTQEMVARMVVHEADRFIGKSVPYYRDRDGVVLHEGDSKAEENAWNSVTMTMAIIMMPNHPNAPAWREANIELQLSAYSAPEDIHSRKRIDGVVMGELLQGSNIYSDGTLVNHKRLHPDYMTSIVNNVANVWMHKMAGIKPLSSSTHNGALVYSALTELDFDGQTIYQLDDNGLPTHTLYFPEGNDWGGERQANYWLMDIMAYLHKWGKGQKIKPLEWAKVRSREMVRMMDRDTTGQYYQSDAEDRFYSKEEWIGQHLAWGYLGMWMDNK